MKRWILLAALLTGCRPPNDGKVHVTYWEKWTGAEAAAMQVVVDQFNESQNRIEVEYLSMSNVDRKTIVATAGGDPPDVAGLWLANLYSFADRDALLPLDDFIRADGQTPAQWLAQYVPVYANMCTYRGKIWAALSTPAATALHWNKRLFAEAGLDPDRPPRTLAELDEFAAKLTKRDPQTGAITQIGFLPQEPGWFAWAFPKWFGGEYWDGREITLASRPENLAAYQWVASYSKKYGLDEIRAFTSGFGGFASAQNPFMNGKVAMVLQGVWMNNYLRQYAPGLTYGVAAWPAVYPGEVNFNAVDADILLIPRGAKHPREAWEFIRYVNSLNPTAQRREDLRGMELLCYLQQKNSPLREWSPFFTEHHPNPYIKIFRQLAASPNAVAIPKLGIWEEYRRELGATFDAVRLLTESPTAAVTFANRRVTESWKIHRLSLERRGLLPPDESPTP